MAKKRRDELSWMNSLFCLLVIFIHLLSDPVVSLSPGSWQHALACVVQRMSFAAVYGFFLLSGVKLFLSPEMRGKGKVDWKRYYLKRARTVAVPYLIAETVYCLYAAATGQSAFSPVTLLKYFLNGNAYAHFYYVVALIQFILLAPLWRRWVRKYSPAWMIPISIGVSWGVGMNLYYVLPRLGLAFAYQDRTFVQYLCFYLTGCYIGANYDAFLRQVRAYRGLILGCFAAFAALDGVYSWLYYAAGEVTPQMEAVHQMFLTSAIILCLWAALGRGRIRAPFRQLDQVSYLVFLYHLLGFQIFERLAGGRIAGTVPLLAAKGLFTLCVTFPLCILWRFCAVRIKSVLPGTSH